MPYASTVGFVLGASAWGEQDKIVHLLTQKRGILKAIAPGALKVKNRFGSLLELLTEGDFVYYWNEDKEMVTLSKGEIVRSYFHLVSRPENIFYFYLITEIILKFTPSQHREIRLFKLLQSILTNRDQGIDIHHLLLYFLIWILRIEGMMFKPDFCYNCSNRGLKAAWVKTNFRGILCRQCHTDEAIKLEAEDLNYIQWTETHNPREINAWTNRLNPGELIRLFVKKIEYHGEFALKCTHYLPEFR